jgi:hypothetical protein
MSSPSTHLGSVPTEAAPSASPDRDEWPALPLDAWRPTRDTLHMYAQVVGKLKLALLPMEPQWGQVPFYVTSRGLTTSPLPYGSRTFSVTFDLIAHELDIATSAGERRTFGLGGSVAEFYFETMGALRSLGIEVSYRPQPVEVSNQVPFPEDTVHSSYDPDSVNRFFRVLSRIDPVLKRHRAEFTGRASQVALFWGTLDLAYSRYSGRPAEPPPGSDLIYRLAMNVETIEAGFWPGDERYGAPAFYSFTYPKPNGIESAVLEPRLAFWSPELSEFILRYDDVRAAASPEDAIFDFFESSYQAGRTRAGWNGVEH